MGELLVLQLRLSDIEKRMPMCCRELQGPTYPKGGNIVYFFMSKHVKGNSNNHLCIDINLANLVKLRILCMEDVPGT